MLEIINSRVITSNVAITLNILGSEKTFFNCECTLINTHTISDYEVTIPSKIYPGEKSYAEIFGIDVITHSEFIGWITVGKINTIEIKVRGYRGLDGKIKLVTVDEPENQVTVVFNEE